MLLMQIITAHMSIYHCLVLLLPPPHRQYKTSDTIGTRNTSFHLHTYNELSQQ